ncbi:hypothetical protein [Actinophytocola oryzae]|uniref:hypothetical protein n=1 Tax=Actinophytocola oryzae TaxID=502181 RepID=UPI001414F4E9|nr:hypothetical protein [Actinophytocola oryzae]
MDCAERNYTPWQLVCRLAEELSGSWPEFGAIRFRRVWLAQVAASIHDLSDDPADTTRNCARVRDELRRLVRVRERVGAVARTLEDVGLTLDARQALDISSAEVRLVGQLLQSAVSSRYAVDALFRTGLSWYGARGKRNEDGVHELVRLNLSFHDAARRREAERTLVAAFLADIEAAYTRRNRPFNCVVLLDNCHREAGSTVLDLVAQARATSETCEPVVVVAAAGALPELTGLRTRWRLPWEPERAGSAQEPTRREVPTARSVTHGAWSGARDREATGSWWLPVWLCDLTSTEIGESVPAEHVRFVDDLTHGHPWSVQELAPTLTEPRSRRAVLDGFRYEHLLAGLPDRSREKLILWSAARDLDAAQGALGARHSDLPDWLEKSLWLTAGPRRLPRLHPWLRRVLLWQLAGMGKNQWNDVHGTLETWARAVGNRKKTNDIWYHSLARGELGPVVDYLIDLQLDADAESWIDEFDEITEAPGLHRYAESADARYDELLSLCPNETGPRRVVWSLVAARWIWRDPLGDPEFTLTGAIAHEFDLLADVFQTGRNRFHREAEAYRKKTS